jgi:hypothetical protein
MENDEKKYGKLIKDLKNLQQVKAPANFESDLKRRINAEKFSKEEKKSFWENILMPAKLIPSLGLVAAAVVIFFVVETNSEELDNPFLIEPRVREDIIAVTGYEELEQERQKESSKTKILEKDTRAPEPRTDKSELKSSDEEVVSGRKKTGDMDQLSDEKGFARDQSNTEGNVTVPESTFAGVTESPQPTVTNEVSSEIVSGQSITKEELNFRQVQLSTEEQKVVNDLKMQVQSLEKADQHQK